jgi:hypothetical protein
MKQQKFTIVNKLIFGTLNTTKTKLLFADSSFYIKVLFIFSSQAQCKISLKFLLILHLVNKCLYSNTLRVHFNFKNALF